MYLEESPENSLLFRRHKARQRVLPTHFQEFPRLVQPAPTPEESAVVASKFSSVSCVSDPATFGIEVLPKTAIVSERTQERAASTLLV